MYVNLPELAGNRLVLGFQHYKKKMHLSLRNSKSQRYLPPLARQDPSPPKLLRKQLRAAVNADSLYQSSRCIFNQASSNRNVSFRLVKLPPLGPVQASASLATSTLFKTQMLAKQAKTEDPRVRLE